MEISAVVIARNEEGNIARCLKSLQWADDIVVVDAESEDRTPRIAEALGARVIVKPWPGVSGTQYQFAISQAKWGWVLVVDADEEVTPELSEEIRKTLSGETPFVAFRVPRVNFAMGRWLTLGGWRESVVRLIHRDHVRYRPSYHSRQEISGRVGALLSPLRHYLATDMVRWWMRSLGRARAEAELAFAGGARFSGLKVVMGFWKFLRRFVFKLGFLYGWCGFFICLQRFICVAALQACLLELQLGVRRPDKEPDKMPSG
jgi:glycosyltransferase involved in cell wall biosynthesis